jgi:glycosyltransferase involved in cell wall biosynthesis
MYNEGDHIQESVEELLRVLETLDTSWEYILVDDGSTDDSRAIAEEILAGRPNCHLIHYKPNRGRGFALRQGFAVAKGKYIVTTESDLSWGSEIIGELFCALKTTNADMVIASAYAPGGALENVPGHRLLLSKVGNWILRWAFEGQISMLSGMTRGYRGQAIQSVLLEQNRKEIHLEIVDKFQALGFSIVEIPGTIRWEAPNPGQGRGKGGWGIWRFVVPHLRFTFHRASARLLLWLGAGTGTLGTVFVVASTINKVFHVLPLPLPNLLNYGLVLWVMSLLMILFSFISIQLQFMYSSIVHLQSQLKDIQRQQG